MWHTVGLHIQGKKFYHHIEHWINHNPQALWDAIQNERLSLCHDAYLELRRRMAFIEPEKVKEGLDRKAKAAILKKIKSKLGDPNVKLV